MNSTNAMTMSSGNAGWRVNAAIYLIVCATAALMVVYGGIYVGRGPGWMDAPTLQLLLLLPVGLGAGALGYWVVLKRPTAGLLILVALLYTNASEIGVRRYGLPSTLQLLSFATAAGILFRLIPRGGRPGQRFVFDPLFVPLALYGLVIFASSLEAANIGLADQRLSEILKGLLTFIVVTNLTRSELTLRRVVWALVLSGAFLATISVYQVATHSLDQDFGGFGRTKIAEIVGESREPRIAGSLSDPNFYAQILVMLAPLALYRLWDEPRLSRKLLAGYALATVTLAAVFTYSRGGAIALGIVLLLAMLQKRISLKYFLIGALTLAPLTLVIPQSFGERLGTLTQLAPDENSSAEGEDSSFRHRQMLMTVALHMFEDHPVFGVGAGNYSENYSEYANRMGMTQRSFENFGEPTFPHELYLQIGAETGVVGLISFFSIIAGTMASLLAAYRSFRGAGAIGSANIVVSLGLAVAAFLLTSLFLHATYIYYLWLIVAIVAAARQVGRRTLAGQHDE